MNNSYQSKAAAFFLPVLIFLTAVFGISAQETSRGRTVTPTPTPASSATPKSSPTPAVTPVPKLTPVPAVTPVQSLADLQSRIRLSLARPELRRGNYGVKIVSLQTGKTIYEENGDKYLMPASNMKSFTVATALERLSPNFRFVTSVYAPAMPDAGGLVKGDLRIFGRGDVSISTAFYESDYYKGLDALADKIVQSGVKRVEGNLIGDDSYFTGSPIPVGWEWDDLQWYYGAEISALPVNDNALDLSIRPSTAGAPCTVQLLPANSVMRIVNRCLTTGPGSVRDLAVKKDLDQNVLEISGSLPVGDKGFSNPLAVSHPSELFIQLLRQRLELKGVVITGQTRTFGEKEKQMAGNSATAAPPVEIAKLESFPFSLIAAKTMKPSQNMYTETILRALGEQAKTLSLPGVPADNPFNNPKISSADKGLYAVQNFIRQVGIPADSLVQFDGCGLSRHDLVTVNALAQLYIYMSKSRYAQVWRESLPVGGVDGTLKSRFAAASTAGNVRAKTGTIDQVSALSGYVTTAAGEPLVFSIIVNGVTTSSPRLAAIDEIVISLANFNGKVN